MERNQLSMALLGVNIDHVATVRQARRTYEPDPVWAAVSAQLGGADGITVHLREDARHIQRRDVQLLRQTVHVKLNLEMACAEEVVQFACQIQPQQATLVPERREEVTTEGGLDVVSSPVRVGEVVKRLQGEGIEVSLFLDPEPRQIELGAELGAQAIELHTGTYALASGRAQRDHLGKLAMAGQLVRQLGMTLNAGHGLNYRNVQAVAQLEGMHELNIGHSIVARSLFVGLQQAVREMKTLIA